MKSLIHFRLFKLNLGPYVFSPGLLPSIVTLFFVYVMMSLGIWQMERAEFKHHLETTMAERKDLPPVSLQELPHDELERRFLPVTVTGRFDPAQQFLFDNRIVNGRAGYDVYTPFHINNGESILVNRGWLPLGKTRQDLPDLTVTNKNVSFKGLLNTSPTKDFLLSDQVNQFSGWPMVLQYVIPAELESELGYPLMSMVLWLDENENYGYHRQLPVVNLNAEKNSGYAFQWFAMTIALLMIYFIVNTKKRNDTND